jgi:hypothetical protein
MTAHKTRRGWRGWLVAGLVALALSVEAAAGFVFLVVLVEIARSL